MVDILPIGTLQPINEEGNIVNTAKIQLIVSPWSDAVNSMIGCYQNHYGESLHSVYVRGSVPQGTAVEFLSDIDTIALIEASDEQVHHSWRGPFLEELKKTYPFATDFELEPLPKTNVLESDNYFTDRFLLKNTAVCVFGDDVIPKIPEFAPTKEVAKQLHGFYEKDLMNVIQKVQNNTAQKTDSLCTWIMKRTVRTGFAIVMEAEKAYTRDLYPCYRIFSKHYPEKEKNMLQALSWAINPNRNHPQLLAFLNTFGSWLAGEVKARLG